MAALKGAAARHGLKPPQVMMPLRVLVCGTPQTPAIDAVLGLLGREAVRARIAAALATVAKSPARPPSRVANRWPIAASSGKMQISGTCRP